MPRSVNHLRWKLPCEVFSKRGVNKVFGTILLLAGILPFFYLISCYFPVLLLVLSVLDMKDLLKGFTIITWFCLGEILNTHPGIDLGYLNNFFRRILIVFLFCFLDKQSKASLQSV